MNCEILAANARADCCAGMPTQDKLITACAALAVLTVDVVLASFLPGRSSRFVWTTHLGCKYDLFTGDTSLMAGVNIFCYPRARYNGAAVASSAKTTPSLSWTTPSPQRPTWPRCTTPTMPTRKQKIQNLETTITLPVVVEELLRHGEQRRRQTREPSVDFMHLLCA